MGSLGHLKCLQSWHEVKRSEGKVARLRRTRTRNLGLPETKIPSNNVLAKLLLIEIFDGRCVICGGFLGSPRGTSDVDVQRLIKTTAGATIQIGDINLDHMEPSSSGGPDHLLNYGPSHEHCNKSRQNKPASDAQIQRFDEVWIAYESSGHRQMMGRMIVIAKNIDLYPGFWLNEDVDGDPLALRLDVEPCSYGHIFHIRPDDADFCMLQGDTEHQCWDGTCGWFSSDVDCWLKNGMQSRRGRLFPLFFEGIGRGHTIEIARFLEAFSYI